MLPLAELDARYLAGEAADHAATWSGLIDAYASLNRHEVPPTGPNLVDVDHRPLAPIAAGDMITYLQEFVADLAHLSVYAESVHRLTDRGAVVTHVAVGTSEAGFDAEWRMVYFAFLENGLLNHGEIFEESDLDTALARFDEITEQKPRLENRATRIWTRLSDAYNRRDLDDFVSLGTADGSLHDRRKGLQSVLTGPATAPESPSNTGSFARTAGD